MGKSDTIPSPIAARPASELALRQAHLPQPWQQRPPEDDDDNALSLHDLLQIVLKHKWTLLVVVLMAVIIAGINTFLSRPIYRATTVLQIDSRPQRVVDFNNSGMDVEQMTTDEFMALKTQQELLRSRSLAERVIDELQLDQSKAAPAPGTAGAPAAGGASAPASEGYVARILSGYRKLSTPSSTDQRLLGREGVIGAFLGSLAVEPVQNSRLVRLSVDNTDPVLAARIANTTAQIFVSLGQERRIESSAYTKGFLEEQIQQMKAKLEESERKLNQYAQLKQILTLDEKTNVLSQSYTEYAAALAKAEQDRIRLEAQFAEVKRNPESGTQDAQIKTISSYKENRAKLLLEYQQNLRIYKPDYPKMQQIKAQIDELENQIKGEYANTISVARSQFDAARQLEADLREKVAQTRKQVLVTQDSGIEYNLLKREVDTNRQLYDGLLQRLKQVGVASNLTTNNVSIVDAAAQPLFPYKPNLQSNLMAGMGIGLFLGLCLVFVLEFMDDSIKFPEEIERALGLPLMGVIPVADRKRGDDKADVGLNVHHDPRSTMAEAYRSVRTALQFSTSHGAPTRLLISSTTRDEGKSTTALALAINFAQMGHRVLLVDADMRNPTVHKMLGMPNEIGLSNLLSADSRGETLIQPTMVTNLSVLTAGPPPPNPVDLLMGPKLLQLLDKATAVGFSHVVVDGPPILGIADSIVLGNQIQDMLFIVRARATRKSHIRDALRRMRLSGLVPRGAVLTFTPSRELQGYGSYYGYGAEQRVPAARGGLLRGQQS